jgi:hypothetical protein
VNHLFGLYHAVQVGSGIRANEWFALARITILWRRSMLRNKSKAVTFREREIAELGVANSNSILQHGFKYRLQFTWRRTYDVQHIRRSRLLFQRLAKIGGALTQLIEQTRVLDGDDGLTGKIPHKFDLHGRTS